MSKEIEELFKYIDGKIVEYDYIKSGELEEKRENGKIYYYSCYPEFKFSTDSHKTYSIEFSYHYIFDEHPEYEGINMIIIQESDNYDNKLIIGRNYYQ